MGPGSFMSFRWFATLPLVLPLLALPHGCMVQVPPAEAAPKTNVILILVDTLRADKIGAFGYTQRKTTPNLDAFAAGGMVWERTESQNAWTVPSVASLFTGVDPQAHRTLNFKVGEKLATDTMSLQHDTISESFKAAGYGTAAFVKSTVISTSKGFSQGFDTFQVVGGKDQAWGYSARDLNDAAIPWLTTQATSGKPFFAYLHFMDPHSPYKAPEPYYSKYKGSYAGKMDGAHVQLEDAFKAGTVTAADWEHELALYDAEIEYFDAEFGRLWSELKKVGADKNTVVVLVADHGEAFGEHKNVFHGNLYQENIHVPVILRGPGIKAGRMKAWAQLVDVAPTLAELFALPKGKGWQGKSMVGAMGGGAGHSDVIYSEYAGQRMVIDPASSLKLIVGDGPTKLYDLVADPLEKNNLAESRSADVARLKPLLDARFLAGQSLSKQFPIEAGTGMTKEQCEMLLQLGYVKDCDMEHDDGDGK